jgi:predicted dehydrogenase
MIGIGLYGNNGHQIQRLLRDHLRARLVAFAGFPRTALPTSLQNDSSIRECETLEELLEDDRVGLVSLCSPVRAEQPAHAEQCLTAGRHVYAEKPAALDEPTLDRLVEKSEQTRCRFHEMAGTAFEQPFLEMRRLVAEGTVGEVAHVLAQKSYPYHDRRPQDERIDGGLTLQVGVHAFRFVEHVAQVRIRRVQTMESSCGNPASGDLRMAVCVAAELENGGVASILCNYFNPQAFGSWGNECLRIWGPDGMLEATDGGARTRLVLAETDCGPLVPHDAPRAYFDRVLAEVLDGTPLPLSLEDELRPTRWAIRARDAARAG